MVKDVMVHLDLGVLATKNVASKRPDEPYHSKFCANYIHCMGVRRRARSIRKAKRLDGSDKTDAWKVGRPARWKA